MLSAAPALPLLGLVPLVRVAEQTVDVPLDRHSLPHIRLGLAVLRIEGFFLFRQLPPLLFQRVHLWELRPIQQLIDRRLCRPVVSQLRPMLGQIFFAVPGRLVTVEYGPRLCVLHHRPHKLGSMGESGLRVPQLPGKGVKAIHRRLGAGGPRVIVGQTMLPEIQIFTGGPQLIIPHFLLSQRLGIGDGPPRLERLTLHLLAVKIDVHVDRPVEIAFGIGAHVDRPLGRVVFVCFLVRGLFHLKHMIAPLIHPGNTNEQTTAIPVEKELLNMVGTSKFIYCSAGGLGSFSIREFNSMGGRAFIVTQSIKKLSDVLKDAIFNDCDYRLLSNDMPISVEHLKTFDRKDSASRSLYDDKAYRIIEANRIVDLGLTEEKTLVSGKKKSVRSKGTLKQRIIVTFSRKMMEYQRTIRNRQIERAKKMIKACDPEEIKKGPNDVRRFMKRIAKGKDGKEASVRYEIDEEKIREEEKYDGYYAVATNLEDPTRDILAVFGKRSQIEDCLRIMKTSFDARPGFHHNPERIKAHFLICYTALLIYRLIEVQLDDRKKHHTVEEVRTTLKNMNITEEFNVYYKALYTGSRTLTDLVTVLDLPLDHLYYQASELKRMIKKIQG